MLCLGLGRCNLFLLVELHFHYQKMERALLSIVETSSTRYFCHQMLTLLQQVPKSYALTNNFLMGADRLRASELCVQYRVDCLSFWDRSFELSLDVDLASTRSQIPSPQIILSRNHHSLERLDSDNFGSIILFSQRTTTSRGTYNVMA